MRFVNTNIVVLAIVTLALGIMPSAVFADSGIFTSANTITEDGYDVTVTANSNYSGFCGTNQYSIYVEIGAEIEIDDFSISPAPANYYPYRHLVTLYYADSTYEQFGWNSQPVANTIGKRPIAFDLYGECGGVPIQIDFTYHLVTPPLTRPLVANDRVAIARVPENPALDGYYANRGGIGFLSNNISANVSAVSSGVVTDVRPVELRDCFINSIIDPPLGEYPIPGACVFYYSPKQTTELRSNSFTVYFVTIIDGANEYKQLVTNAPDYVVEGQNITAGCTLGKPVTVSNEHIDTIRNAFLAINPEVALFYSLMQGHENDTVSAITYAWVNEQEYPDNDAWDWYTQEPKDQSPCNVRTGFEGCIGDAELKDYTQWDYTNGVVWNNPGAFIGANDTISAVMNLDATREMTLDVGIYEGSQGTTQKVRLQLGTTTQDFEFTGQNVAGKFSIASDLHAPDAGGFYTVSVKNTGQSLLRVDYICVRFSDETAPTPTPTTEPNTPGSPPPDETVCTFANSDFNDGTNGWTVPESGAGAGEVHLATSQVIVQNVSKPAGTYALSVVATIWAYNTYAPNQQNTDDVTLDYSFPYSVTFNTIGTKTYGEFAQNTVVVFRTTVTLGSDTSGDFAIRATLNSAPSGVRGVAIRSVCLGQNVDNPPAGFDAGEESGGIFVATCTKIPNPTDNGILTNITWLWAKLNSFFQCDLMKLLNSMYKLGLQQFTMLGWSVRWAQASVISGTNWISGQFVPWLGGYLDNIAIGRQVTYVNETADECNNIFCLISQIGNSFISFLNNGLGLISQILTNILQPLFDSLIRIIERVINLLLDIIERVVILFLDIVVRIINVFFRILDIVLDVINQITSLFAGFANAFNTATPVTIDGLPNCNINPKGNGYCIALWMMENTIFSGRGALLIPLIIAFAYTLTLIRTVKSLRKMVMELGQNA